MVVTRDESGEDALWRLRLWQSEVEAMFRGRPPVHPVLVALAGTVRRFEIPPEPCLDLIAAAAAPSGRSKALSGIPLGMTTGLTPRPSMSCFM